MMRLLRNPVFLFLLACVPVLRAYLAPADYPFAPAAGEPGSTAIAHDDPAFVGWATGFSSLVYGTDVDVAWQTPSRALGPSMAQVGDVVSLGRGGMISLTFLHPIRDGNGADFAVFENGFGPTFLELAWVEVSTDGIHFVRFPNYSATAFPVPGYGGIDPEKLHGYASKYELGYGTPFDLEHLAGAHADVLAGTDPFSDAYREHLLANFPHLDLNAINHVRVVDIIGDGNARSAARDPDGNGYAIYDMYPTSGSAGVDLEAVGVLNQVDPRGLSQGIAFDPIPNQRLVTGSIDLTATADSGLPVTFTVLEGPAFVSGNQLTFTGKGRVTVQARQPGNAVFAPALPETRSFIIADEIQHIFFEPVSHQLVGAPYVQLSAYASSGLPVYMEVFDGPPQASVGIVDQRFTPGPEPGPVTIRAFQPGDAAFAPAEDVFMTFAILDPSDPDAPLTFAAYAAAKGLSGNPSIDADRDGASDGIEFALAGDPLDSGIRALPPVAVTGPELELVLATDLRAKAPVSIRSSGNLVDWTRAVPRIVSQETGSRNDRPVRIMTLRIQKTSMHQFWRIEVDL